LWNTFNKILFLPILDVLAPPACLACGTQIEAGKFLCAQCYQQLHWIEPPFCQHCGLPLKDQADCHCATEAADNMFSALVFEHEISRKLVHAFKYQEFFSMAKFWAKALAQQCHKYQRLEAADLVTFVPLHSAKKRQRGFNQAALIAKFFSKETNIPFAKVLQRVEYTNTQTHLNRLERKQNVASAFAIMPKQDIRQKRIILIDDVITSGATIEACATVLKNAGAASVLARSPLRAVC